MKSRMERKVGVNFYDNLPLRFERNDGQTDARVKFISRGNGYTLFLTPSEAVLASARAGKKGVLRVRMVGANPHARIEGIDQLAGRSNYFIGNDPNKWRTNIPSYSKVRYGNVYPGVDLVYYGARQRQLEYDFIVAPGANPATIKLRFEGSTQLELNSNGDLTVRLAGSGEVINHAPVIYQERNREKVNGKFVLEGKDAVRFQLAAYDRKRAMNIDPGLVFLTYLGGSPGTSPNGNDQGNAIVIDSSGNVFVTGPAASANFPTTGGAFQTTNDAASANTVTGFVTKLNAGGSTLAYSTFLGGNGHELPTGIAVDSKSGDAYVMGRSESITNAGCTAAGTPTGCCTGGWHRYLRPFSHHCGRVSDC